MNRFRLLLLTAVAFVAIASTASGQSVEASRAGMPRVNLVSANPIGLLFEWYNGEFEHALNSTTSLALAASRFSDLEDFSDSRYSVVDGIARYYPGARALRGFSVGVSVGFVDFDEDIGDCLGCVAETGTAATIGVRGDYVWIIGRDQHFAVAAGIGAKRLVGNDIGPEGLPIGRLSIGYAW